MASLREFYEELTQYLAQIRALVNQAGTPATNEYDTWYVAGYRDMLEAFKTTWETTEIWYKEISWASWNEEVYCPDYHGHMDRIKAKIAWRLGLLDVTEMVTIPELLALLTQYAIRQADLVQRLAVPKSLVSMWFNGKRPMPPYRYHDFVALAALARDAIAAGGQGQDALADWQPTNHVFRHPSGKTSDKANGPDWSMSNLDGAALQDRRRRLEMELQWVYFLQERRAKMPP